MSGRALQPLNHTPRTRAATSQAHTATQRVLAHLVASPAPVVRPTSCLNFTSGPKVAPAFTGVEEDMGSEEASDEKEVRMAGWADPH